MDELPIIRVATEADAAGIARVQVQTWQSTYRGIVPDDFLDAMTVEKQTAFWVHEIERVWARNGFVIVGERKGELIGFASGGREREKIDGYDGELYAIYILPSEQRRGLGRKLMTESARLLMGSGFQSMLVWVLRDNPSCRFYESVGGRFVREKQITIGLSSLPEVAYGWGELAAFFPAAK